MLQVSRILSLISRCKTKIVLEESNNTSIRSYLANIFLRIEELYSNIILFDKNKLWRVLLSPKLWFFLVIGAIKLSFSDILLLDEGNGAEKDPSDKSGGEGTGGRDRTSTGSRDGTATSPTSVPGNTNRLNTASDTTSEIDTSSISDEDETEPSYTYTSRWRQPNSSIFNRISDYYSVPENPFLFRGTGVTGSNVPRTPNPYPFTFMSPSPLRVRELSQVPQDPGRFIPRSTPAANPFNIVGGPSRSVGDLSNTVARPTTGPSRSVTDLPNPVVDPSRPVAEPSRSVTDLSNSVADPSRPVAEPVTGPSSSPTDPSDSSATEITLTIRKRKADSDSEDMDFSKKPKKD